MRNRRVRLFVTSVALAAAALPCAPIALAQGVGGADKGYTPMGRRGYEWQAEMELAKEELKRFEAQLAALSADEWRARSIAWLEFAIEPSARRIQLPASFHVGEVDPGKRAEIEVTSEYDALDPTWAIAYPKKAPRELRLVMTDEASTAVTCPIGEAVDRAVPGSLGIFVHDTTLVCLFRPDVVQ